MLTRAETKTYYRLLLLGHGFSKPATKASPESGC